MEQTAEKKKMDEITIKFGKGCVGEGADGKKIWETEKTKVSNRDLKGMVEFYKSRGKEQEEKPRESLKDRLSEKKAEVSQQKHDAPQKTATKSKEASL